MLQRWASEVLHTALYSASLNCLYYICTLWLKEVAQYKPAYVGLHIGIELGPATAVTLPNPALVLV